MTTAVASEFSQLDQALQSGGVVGVLEKLAGDLAASKQYHELFEARKMQVRARLGLPLLHSTQPDELDEQRRNQLEEGLLAACSEVGLLFLDAGQVREGWMYLRPVGDRAAALAALAKIEPNEENREALMEVCLYEGVDVTRGFQMLLDQNGTCNSITTFDGLMQGRTAAEQKPAALPLLRHVYKELRESLRGDITRQQGSPPAETTVATLIAERDWLTSGGAYHLDTTHLAAAVRIARVLDDPQSHREAYELCLYGQRLNPQLQYTAGEPFVENYPAHALYFQALLGENTAAALAFFRTKAETLDRQEHGLVPLETYIDLLARMNRPAEALREAIRLMPEGRTNLSNTPPLIELARRCGQFDELLAFTRARGDLLSYGTALAEAQLASGKK